MPHYRQPTYHNYCQCYCAFHHSKGSMSLNADHSQRFRNKKTTGTKNNCCYYSIVLAIRKCKYQDGRNRPAYTTHVHVHERSHKKAQQTTAVVQRYTFDLRIKPTQGQPASCRARPVSIDGGPKDTMWVRGLGCKKLPTTSCALRSDLNIDSCLSIERGRGFGQAYAMLPKQNATLIFGV